MSADPMTTTQAPEGVALLIRELDAKAWQCHRIGAGKAKREQHVTYRAARALEALSVPVNGQGSEPVAWRYRWKPTARSAPGEWRPPTHERWSAEEHACFEEQPLYAAQQAPISGKPAGVGWLVEREDLDRRTLYMCEARGGHGWTPDVHAARRFDTEAEASAWCSGGDADGPLKVAEHAWVNL